MLHGVTANDDRRLSGCEKNLTEGGNKEKHHRAVAHQGASLPTQVCCAFPPLALRVLSQKSTYLRIPAMQTKLRSRFKKNFLR